MICPLQSLKHSQGERIEELPPNANTAACECSSHLVAPPFRLQNASKWEVEVRGGGSPNQPTGSKDCGLWGTVFLLMQKNAFKKMQNFAVQTPAGGSSDDCWDTGSILVVRDLAAPAQWWHKHVSLYGLQAATSSKARVGTHHAALRVDCKLRSNAQGCV